MNELLKKIGEPAALENLAEECSELSHAALKLARVLRNENPTPITEEEARHNVEKELADVLASAYISDLKMDADFVKTKLERADERLACKTDVYIGKPPKKHLVLCGPTGSGKSTLARYLHRNQSFDIRRTYTTRSPRDGEDNFGEYRYVDKKVFYEMMKDCGFDFLKTYKTASGPVAYGYDWSIFETENYSVSVMSYDELLYMHKTHPELFDKLFVVYLDTPEHISQKRAIARGDDSFEVTRRLLSERSVFTELQATYGFDLVYSDYSESTENIANNILFKMHL